MVYTWESIKGDASTIVETLDIERVEGTASRTIRRAPQEGEPGTFVLLG